MSQPQATPAIATQAAVRRLPRWALLLLCFAYVIPGFVARTPWKNADVAAFGVMSDLAAGRTDWLSPVVLGQAPDTPGLLPYWLGAWAIQLLPSHPEYAVRVPFILAIAVAMFLVWHAVFRFALQPSAQPVAFAFGGEARPVDYARSLADGGLLALLACLGLAQLAHETTPAVIQLLAVAGMLRAMASFATSGVFSAEPAVTWLLGWLMLAWSGAPDVALLVCGLPALLHWKSRHITPVQTVRQRDFHPLALGIWAAGFAGIAVSAWFWVSRATPLFGNVQLDGEQVATLGKLLFWFSWPVWPLALWTLWRWRRHLSAPHLLGPLCLSLALISSITWAPSADRALLLALPPLAVLAAFALPTLKRSFAALVDWFSVLFFSLCSVTVWVVWVAMLTGFPAKPAANVARLAPGFAMEFSMPAFSAAALATAAWVLVVRWRLSRHPTVIWKSLVLAATGSTLCWLLLMSLWMPLLDFARSYAPISRRIATLVPAGGSCTEVFGLSQAQIAGLRHHGKLDLRLAPSSELCGSLVVAQQAASQMSETLDITQWAFKAKLSRLTDNKESLLLYVRVGYKPEAVQRGAGD